MEPGWFQKGHSCTDNVIVVQQTLRKHFRVNVDLLWAVMKKIGIHYKPLQWDTYFIRAVWQNTYPKIANILFLGHAIILFLFKSSVPHSDYFIFVTIHKLHFLPVLAVSHIIDMGSVVKKNPLLKYLQTVNVKFTTIISRESPASISSQPQLARLKFSFWLQVSHVKISTDHDPLIYI